MEEEKGIEIKRIFRALDDYEFLNTVPLNVNRRETYVNIKILKASIQLYKKGLLSMSEFHQGLLAFTLTEKDYYSVGGNIPADVFVIMGALRMINKAISENLIAAWIEKCRPFLESEQPERKDLERKFMDFDPDERILPMIYPHEFLFLLSNCKNRIDMINRIHKRGENLGRETKFNTFVIDSSDFGVKSVNRQVQNILNSEVDPGRVRISGLPLFEEGKQGNKQLKSKKSAVAVFDAREEIKEIRELLDDKQLFRRIQKQIDSANYVLKCSKLGGKLNSEFMNIINNIESPTPLQSSPHKYKLSRVGSNNTINLREPSLMSNRPTSVSNLKFRPKNHITENKFMTTCSSLNMKKFRKEAILEQTQKLKFNFASPRVREVDSQRAKQKKIRGHALDMMDEELETFITKQKSQERPGTARLFNDFIYSPRIQL